jgi:hypothetical protein
MPFARFYGHFAAAYGTFLFLAWLAALVESSHVIVDAFWAVVFPAFALVYALFRTLATSGSSGEIARLRERVAMLEDALDASRRGIHDAAAP